ncbi:CAP domain-containing protein [Actinokineospora spheciospongiae]|uniref:CAP domain-containing protein n=1 Tax=Actinokineospora spheciospongiae TaxID=909613 RepID=UPI000D8476AF|nr:CAP domain-containing protein [Actinokineospora spheciospongiae]PWW54273.1 uncharacterized protein YkwD [Actinokineospora spheciospongiae]
MLVALAVGAGTAGVTTVLGLAPGAGAGADRSDEVALGLSAQRIVIPPQDAPTPVDAPSGNGGGPPDRPENPGTGSPAPSSTTAPPPETPPSSDPPPPPPATTTTEAPPTTRAAKADARVLALVNDERATAGCDPLAPDDRLTAAAQAHAVDMSANDYFSHVSQDGRSFVDRSRATGHPDPAAENIAKGQRTAEDVMRAWMDSPGHRANILDCDLKTLGVGFTAEGHYWVQDFGR